MPFGNRPDLDPAEVSSFISPGITIPLQTGCTGLFNPLIQINNTSL